MYFKQIATLLSECFKINFFRRTRYITCFTV